MRKLATTSLATLMAVSAVMPALTTTPAEARRGRNLAIGAGVVLGAAALAAAADARGYRGHGWRSQCRRWYRRCEYGNDWACEKYERHCDY